MIHCSLMRLSNPMKFFNNQLPICDASLPFPNLTICNHLIDSLAGSLVFLSISVIHRVARSLTRLDAEFQLDSSVSSHSFNYVFSFSSLFLYLSPFIFISLSFSFPLLNIPIFFFPHLPFKGL